VAENILLAMSLIALQCALEKDESTAQQAMQRLGSILM